MFIPVQTFTILEVINAQKGFYSNVYEDNRHDTLSSELEGITVEKILTESENLDSNPDFIA